MEKYYFPVVCLKGVFAFVFVAVVVLALLSLPRRPQEDFSRSVVAEKVEYLGLDFKNALRQSLTARNVSETALRMALLEGFFEEKAARDGVSADLWAGFVSQDELTLLTKRMVAEKKALKCGQCFDLSTLFEGVYALSAVLGADGTISSAGVYLFSQAGDKFFQYLGRRPVIAASFYADGIAVVSTAGEGFS